MKIRRFFGKDMRDALKKVKDELGGDAVIMSNKKVANGVELVAAIDQVSAPAVSASAANSRPLDTLNYNPNHNPNYNNTNQPVPPNMQNAGAPSQGSQNYNLQDASLRSPQHRHAEQHPPKTSTVDDQNRFQQSGNSLREIVGDTGPDSLQAFLERQAASAQQKNTQKSNERHANSINQAGAKTDNVSPLHYSQQPHYGARPESRADERIFRSPAFNEPDSSTSFDPRQSTQASGINGATNANNPPPSVLEPAQLDIIKAELESIKNVLKFQVSGLSDERKKRNNPIHHYLHEQLTKMGVSQELSRQLVEFLPYQIDEKLGWKYILNLLSNRLHVGGNDILNQSGIVALVGPTGTGKTTTVAKLAAKYAQKYGPEQVALVTIDTYRIAAFEQLATYGKIIGCAVKKAHSSHELNDILYQMRNKKLVLIDTAGFSQRDARLIDQLSQYEHNLNVNIRKYLVLPAGSQYQVLNQTVKAYRNTQISGCIFTKLDECYSMGEALSVIIENDLSLSYVTDGQRVPEDIKLADSANLTLIAAKLFKRYGNGNAIAIDTHAGAI